VYVGCGCVGFSGVVVFLLFLGLLSGWLFGGCVRCCFVSVMGCGVVLFLGNFSVYRVGGVLGFLVLLGVWFVFLSGFGSVEFVWLKIKCICVRWRLGRLRFCLWLFQNY